MEKEINAGVGLSILGHVNIWLIAVCAIILAVCNFLTNQIFVGDSYTMQIQPNRVVDCADGSTTYYFDLVDYDYHYSAIRFYSKHQLVHAYHRGREIYSFDKTGGAWTASPGSVYNFIDRSSNMRKVRINVKPVYSTVERYVPKFYVGSAYQMYDELLASSIQRFITSLLLIILGLVLIVYYTFMHVELYLNKELIYLAFFSLFSGGWFFNETDAAALLIKNRIMASIVPYYCLILVVPCFVLFFDNYFKIKNRKVQITFVVLSVLQFVVLSYLHFTKIAEYRETLIIPQMFIIIAVIYILVCVINLLVKKSDHSNMFHYAIGMLLLLSAIITDVILYYKDVRDADFYGRYIFLSVVGMVAWDMIKNAHEMIEKGRRAKQLEVFALTDSMTGLFNRNAFETHANADEKLDGVIAVVADANGLKACNDTYGHEAGDEYITIVAAIFNSVYGKYGNCYRTGGDEFCCIISNGQAINRERLKRQFRAKIYNANVEGGYSFNLGVAIGDAIYDATKDEDFRGLVKRADSLMYENKKSSKRCN